MRWRIGLLQDAASIERQANREAAREAARRHKHEVPTVKTAAQMREEGEAAAREATRAAKEDAEPPKPHPRPKIKPLSEAKAIESGANFISETFLFGVAAGLIFFESWRSRRKETSRRDDVAERLVDLEDSERAARKALVELEREVLRLRAKEGKATTETTRRILPREVYEVEQREEDESETTSRGWLSRIASFISTQNRPDQDAKEALETGSPGPAEQVLVQADKQLHERQKQREIDELQQRGTTTKSSLLQSEAK